MQQSDLSGNTSWLNVDAGLERFHIYIYLCNIYNL